MDEAVLVSPINSPSKKLALNSISHDLVDGLRAYLSEYFRPERTDTNPFLAEPHCLRAVSTSPVCGVDGKQYPI